MGSTSSSPTISRKAVEEALEKDDFKKLIELFNMSRDVTPYMKWWDLTLNGIEHEVGHIIYTSLSSYVYHMKENYPAIARTYKERYYRATKIMDGLQEEGYIRIFNKVIRQMVEFRDWRF